MSPLYYRDYFWKEGKPVGKEKLSEPIETCYKIVSDPYRKRITVEKYIWGDFDSLEYDSLLLDFRSLKSENQNGWEKKILPDGSKAVIHDQNDRVILLEHYTFKDKRCIECKTYYPMGILVSLHKVSYKDQGELFNGVILYDAHGRQVMRKEYDMDLHTQEFSELLKEEW